MTVVGNSAPQFTRAANNQPFVLASTAVNTSSEGGGTVGTSSVLAFTPGANDSEVRRIVFIPTASAAATNTTQTVARVFRSTVNTGSTTSSNTTCIGEVPLNVEAADSSTQPVNAVEWNSGERFAGSNSATPEYLLATTHLTPQTNTQWVGVTYARDY